jgi:hypothetical protein
LLTWYEICEMRKVHTMMIRVFFNKNGTESKARGPIGQGGLLCDHIQTKPNKHLSLKYRLLEGPYVVGLNILNLMYHHPSQYYSS